MHPYLPHLFTDIAAAHRTEIPLQDQRPQTFDEHIAEVEDWLAGKEPPQSFGYYCGLNADNFPPPEQLNDAEIKRVLKAFNRMMFSWNLDISLPELLPLPIAYTMTVDTLNQKTSIVNSGTVGFDYCSGHAPDCVFKEYCPCLKIWNEADDVTDVDLPENESPF